MGAYIAFTIILALAVVAMSAFITWKWITKAFDHASLYFLILVTVCIFVAFIGCALGWAGVIK